MATPWDIEDDEPLPGDVVWFLLPLPRTLPLPDGFEYQHVGPAWSDAESGSGLRAPQKGVSLKVHQLDEAVDDGGRLLALVRLASIVFPSEQDLGEGFDEAGREDGPEEDGAQLRGTLTVVEIGVSLLRVQGRRYGRTEALSLSLNLAVWATQDLQRQCGLSGGYPVRPLSIGQLPGVIPVAIGDVAGGLRFYERSLFATTPHNVLAMPGQPSRQFLTRQAVEAAGHRARGHFAAFLRLREEARWLVEVEDEPRLAVITAASAAEVLADAVLIGMLVEERVAPSDAIAIMRSTLMKRLATYYHLRLGGDWASQHSLRSRLRDEVLAPRNQAVHGGSELVSFQAEQVLQSLKAFQDGLCASVASKAEQWPRTLWLLHSAGLVDTVPASVVALRELEADVDWDGIAQRFTTSVLRSAYDAAPEPGQTESLIEVVLVLRGNARQLYIHDTSAGAAAAWEHDLPRQLADEVDSLAISEGDLTLPTAIRAPTSLENLHWRPDFEVLPGYEVTLGAVPTSPADEALP